MVCHRLDELPPDQRALVSENFAGVLRHELEHRGEPLPDKVLFPLGACKAISVAFYKKKKDVVSDSQGSLVSPVESGASANQQATHPGPSQESDYDDEVLETLRGIHASILKLRVSTTVSQDSSVG